VQILASFTTGFTIAFFYDWALTLVVLGVMPLIMIAMTLQMKFMAGFTQAVMITNRLDLQVV